MVGPGLQSAIGGKVEFPCISMGEVEPTAHDARIWAIAVHPRSALIFGKFQRGTFRNEGFGVGLFVVRRAAGLLGGTNEITDELGKGSSFVSVSPQHT